MVITSSENDSGAGRTEIERSGRSRTACAGLWFSCSTKPKALSDRVYRAFLRRGFLVPFSLVRPRRLDLCCCGLSKTGTHSLAGLFEGYRSAHHPDPRVRLRLAARYLRHETEDAVVQRVLGRRDRLLRLEMESSTIAGILIEPLSAACPRKKFILTIRDVYSWCDSWIDHNLNRPPSSSSPWAALDRIRLRIDDFEPTKFDAPLTERGLPPLECYFRLWADHNARVLDVLTPQRLLVVETGQILESVAEIAAWAGVRRETLRTDRGWLFSTPQKHQVLATLDRSYVQDSADQICGRLMHEYFPDVSWSAGVDS
jgi:Sulfotransferase domain